MIALSLAVDHCLPSLCHKGVKLPKVVGARECQIFAITLTTLMVVGSPLEKALGKSTLVIKPFLGEHGGVGPDNILHQPCLLLHKLLDAKFFQNLDLLPLVSSFICGLEAVG